MTTTTENKVTKEFVKNAFDTARAKKEFVIGGQAELDNFERVVLTDKGLESQWNSVFEVKEKEVNGEQVFSFVPKTIERKTAIDKRHVPRTVRQIVKNKENLRFDLAIQRNTVWTLEQKSLFIHSLIYGFPFPPAYAEDKGDGIMWMLDGKQRLTTVIEFCEDKFKLFKNTPDCFGVEIKNKKFSELPEDFKDEILATNFTIYQMVNMTEEERDEMFVRLNKGTPLTKMEQTRAMYSELITQIEMISQLEFFTDHVSMPTNRFADQELILQTAMILDEEHDLRGIGSPEIQRFVMNLKKNEKLLSDEVFDNFFKTDEYLSMAVSNYSEAELKNVLKKVNVPMIVVTALRAIEDKIEAGVFGEFLVDFLISSYNKDSAYGQACQAGSAKKDNVLVRLNEMDKGYANFMNAKLNLQGEEKIKTNHEKLEEAV